MITQDSRLREEDNKISGRDRIFKSLKGLFICRVVYELPSTIHSYEFIGKSPLHKMKSKSGGLIYVKKRGDYENVPHDQYLLAQTAKVSNRYPMKETNLKRKSSTIRKSENIKERLILGRMFNPQITTPISRHEHCRIFPLFSLCTT